MEGGLKGSNKQLQWEDNEENFGRENRDEVDLLEKEEKKSEVVRGIVNENGAEKVLITTALTRRETRLSCFLRPGDQSCANWSKTVLP